MSLPIDETLLERYLDGELDAPLVERVESALATSQECREYLDELTQLRTALRSDIAAAVASAPLDSLWARIEVDLDAEPAVAMKTETETETEAETPPAVAPVAAPTPSRPGLVERLAAWWETQRLEAALGAMAAVAAVALCVWFVRSMPGSATVTDPTRAEAGVPTQDNTLIVESAEVDRGTIVIDVDPEDPSTPAVVWHLVDDEGGRI